MTSSKILKVNDLYEVLNDLSITRLCSVIEEHDRTEIILCGMCKVVYLNTEERFKSYRLLMSSFGQFEWVELSRFKSDKLLKNMYIYYTQGGSKERLVFRGLMIVLIKSFLNDVFKLGYSVLDKTKVSIVRDCYCLYEGEDPDCKCSEKITYRARSQSIYKEGYEDEVLGKFPFSSSSDKMIFEGISCSQSRLTYELYTKFFKVTFNDNKSWHNAAKSLGTAIRKIVNLDIVNQALRVYKDIYFADISLRNYQRFKDCYSITCKPDPLFCLLTNSTYPKHKAALINYDGSNNSVINILRGFNAIVSRAEIKLLRRKPVSYVMLARKTILEQVKDASFAKDNNRRFIFELIRNNNIKSIPVKLISHLAALLLAKNIENHHSDNLIRFFTVWVAGNKCHLSEHRYSKRNDFWHYKVNAFAHALDWLIFTGVTLKKNQDWASVQRAVVKWDLERRNMEIDVELEELGLNNVEWSIDPKVSGYEDDNLKVEELNTPRLLWREGYNQNHCVYDYYSYCMEDQYRVFKVWNASERATLGVYLKKGKNRKYEFDQLVGYGNSVASQKLLESTHVFLKAINK